MSAVKQSPRRQDTNKETESEEELDDDFDIVSKRLMMRSTPDPSTKKDENEADILQRLKDKAIKLTPEQLHALVRYHLKRDQVIIMQQEAATLLRQSVDSEFHSHFYLQYNSSSTTDIQGSIYLKVLMEKYYVLGPGASSVDSASL
jgi:hypothetical protein